MSKLGVLFWRWVFETGDARRLARQQQDVSDLEIMRDIPYIADGDKGHLLDVYQLPDAAADAPTVVNIHGGGLFASYKEVNANFNYQWARMGYRVVSLSYRRIPETTLWHQVADVMAALRYIGDNGPGLGLNLDRCYLTGDSAGALLCLYVLALSGSEKLRREFGIQGSGITFRAAGLISTMLHTRRCDVLCSLRSVITDRTDKGKPYKKYLLDPSMLLESAALPPLFLVTSAQDIIRRESLKLSRLLSQRGFRHRLLDFPKGKGHRLVHVFPVCYPMYPESGEAFRAMDDFFCR